MVHPSKAYRTNLCEIKALTTQVIKVTIAKVQSHVLACSNMEKNLKYIWEANSI